MNRTLELLPRSAGHGAGWLAALLTAWQRKTPSNARQERAVHTLPKRRILAVPHPLGQVVRCLEGCVWITLDDQLADVVIAAGESFTARHDRLVLVQALEPSRVSLMPAAPALPAAR